MFKLFLLIVLITQCSAADFSEHKDKYSRNMIFYENFLNNDEPLTELGKLHLLGLRLLIDIRLNDQRSIYRDSNELYDLTYGNKYLTEELHRRY